MKPLVKLRFNCVDNLIEAFEVDVVEAEPAREFPDTFYRIEFRTVWRQIVESKHGFMLCPPVLV